MICTPTENSGNFETLMFFCIGFKKYEFDYVLLFSKEKLSLKGNLQ